MNLVEIGRIMHRLDIAEASLGVLFVCVEVLQPSQPYGIMLSTVSLPNHTFTGQA